MTKVRIPRAVITALPLLLVNLTAFFGQLGFLRDHLGWPLAGDIVFAVALESIAIYLAYHAHLALVSNDSAMRLRFGSYAAGLLIGLMNYSHYSHDGKPTFTAVAVGLMSAVSPWLWGIHSRRESRDALMRAGLIEPHAVRLGASRWLWHPVKSVRVMSNAVWYGEQSPAEAIAAIEPGSLMRDLPAYDAITLADMPTKADAVRYAIRELARDSSAAASDPAAVAAWLQDQPDGPADVPVSYVRDVIRRDAAAAARQRRSTVRALPGPGSSAAGGSG